VDTVYMIFIVSYLVGFWVVFLYWKQNITISHFIIFLFINKRSF